MLRFATVGSVAVGTDPPAKSNFEVLHSSRKKIMQKFNSTDVINIYVEEDDFLLSPYFKWRLAIFLVALGLSRAKTTDWLADTICSFLLTGGEIYDGDGDEIIIYDEIFDDAYFDDKSHCWNTDVKRAATRFPKRRSAGRLILRLQLFDAALRIIEEPIERP